MATFADVLPIEKISSHKYSTNFEDGWCIGTVPNGGYVTSAFMCVASTHMQSTHTKRNQKHVINLHLEFVRKTDVGTATFVVKDVKIGARVSNLHVTLAQKDDGSEKQVDKVEGYVTMTDMSSEDGATFETGHQMLPQPLPVSLSDLAQNKDVNYVRRGRDPVAFRRASRNMQMHLPRLERRPVDFPKALVDQWVRFRPQGKSGKHTNDSLGYVVDMFPQILEWYVNQDLEEAIVGREVSDEEAKELLATRKSRKAYWYPTLNLNLDVRKALPEEGVEWLFVRIQSTKIENGRLDLQLIVLDEHGDLVATSSHSSLAFDSSRNTTRSRKPQQSKI